jgi:hypothetical protein
LSSAILPAGFKFFRAGSKRYKFGGILPINYESFDGLTHLILRKKIAKVRKLALLRF